jgi:hypothetical protein
MLRISTMENISEKASDDNNQSELSRSPKKKKKKKETHFRKMMNWLEDKKYYSYPAVLLVILGTIIGIGAGVRKIYSTGKDVVEDIKEHFEQRNSTYSAIIKNADAKQALDIIKNYFKDVEYGRFKASNYFAQHVDKYVLVPNITPCQVDSFYKLNSKDFLSPSNEFMDTAYNFSVDTEGNKTIEFWVKFCCFRNRRGKYEHCFTRLQVVFDRNNKIRVFDELTHKDLRFSSSKE